MLIVPSVTHAAWWNPFSWFHKQSTATQVTTTQTTNTTQSEKTVTPSVTSIPTPTKKENHKVTVTSLAPVPPKEVKNTYVAPEPTPTPEVKKDASTNPAVVAIDTFLSSPTLDNLKTFCTNAKTIQGIEQEKVLNDNRTDFTVKTLTLYDDTNDENNYNRRLCSIVLGATNDTTKTYLWTTYNPSYLLTCNPTDSQGLCTVKINYNDYWKSLSQYKLIGYWIDSSGTTSTTPNQAANQAIADIIQKAIKAKRTPNFEGQIYNLDPREFLIPETGLKSVKQAEICKRAGDTSYSCDNLVGQG